MNQYEKDEIDRLPEKYRPLGAWAYFGYQLLFSLPVVGFILLIVYSVSDANINRRSFARSHFCGLLILAIAGIIVGAVVAVIAIVVGPTIFQSLKDLVGQLMEQRG